MESFGRKLKQVIESQGLRIEDVAEATGLSLEQLQALLHDDLDALPNDDVVLRGLRSFARLVQVDEDQVIDDYRRERRSRPVEVSSKVEIVKPPVAILPEEMTKPLRSRRVAIGTLAIVGLAAVTFVLWVRPAAAPASGRPSVDQSEMLPVVHETSEAPADLPGSQTSEPLRPLSPPSSPGLSPTTKVDLSIREHGVGRDIVSHDLAGESRRFKEGERVWFWTRVEGGTTGGSIQHVWIHEAEIEGRVSLRIGGASWRTQSYKDLNAGSAGKWVVEARDDAGRVLARSEFRCSARR